MLQIYVPKNIIQLMWLHVFIKSKGPFHACAIIRESLKKK